MLEAGFEVALDDIAAGLGGVLCGRRLLKSATKQTRVLDEKMREEGCLLKRILISCDRDRRGEGA